MTSEDKEDNEKPGADIWLTEDEMRERGLEPSPEQRLQGEKLRGFCSAVRAGLQ